MASLRQLRIEKAREDLSEYSTEGVNGKFNERMLPRKVEPVSE